MLIECAIEPWQRRHEDQSMAPVRKSLSDGCEFSLVVGNMFENIDVDHRIGSLLRFDYRGSFGKRSVINFKTRPSGQTPRVNRELLVLSA